LLRSRSMINLSTVSMSREYAKNMRKKHQISNKRAFNAGYLPVSVAIMAV
jgi:hypothetical protein